MKRILLSLMTIAIVVTAGIYSTRAYFSDSEQETGNTFSTGTIDISVDETNPWTRTAPYSLLDMKPDVVKYIEFKVKNVGENPVVLWKKIKVASESTGIVTEPECTDQGGTWNGSLCTGGTDDNNIAKNIHYDMTVGGVTLIPESWNIMIKDVDDLWVPLGKVDANQEITIKQSYRLDKDTGNWAQGDIMTFDITLYAEQLLGSGPAHTTRGIVLENKSLDPEWAPVIDGTWGIMTWDGSGAYTFRGFGLDNSLTYHLAYWDGSSETAIDVNSPPSGGELTKTGTYAAFNTNTNAKYWLRPSTSANDKTLWESNLVR